MWRNTSETIVDLTKYSSEKCRLPKDGLEHMIEGFGCIDLELALLGSSQRRASAFI